MKRGSSSKNPRVPSKNEQLKLTDEEDKALDDYMAQTLTVEDTATEDLAESGAENVEQTTKRRAKNELTQKETQAVKRAVNIVYKQLQNSNKNLAMNDVLNALEIKFTNDDSTVGKIDIVEQGEGKLKKGVIHITEEATPKVLIHEIGHFLRANASEEDLRGYRKAYGIDGTKQEEWTKPVSKSLRKQRGITNASANYTYEELFANDFVRYVERGIIPNEEIQSVFDTIKSMLTNIVNNFKGRLSAKTYDTLRETFNGDTAKRQSALSRVNIDINRAETILKDTTLSDEQRSKWEEYKAKKETARDYLLKQRATNERNLGDTTTLFYTDEEKQDIAKRIESLPIIEVVVDNTSLSKADIKNVLSSTSEIVNQYDSTSVVFPKSSAWKIEKVIGKYYSGIVPHLGEMFSSSVLFDITNDESSKSKEKRNSVKQYKHYINKIKYDNEDFYLHFTVMEMSDSRSLIHGLNISLINNYKTERVAPLPLNQMGASTLYDYRISEFLADVKKKDTPTTLFYTEEEASDVIDRLTDDEATFGEYR